MSYPINDHYDGDRFNNLDKSKSEKSWFTVIKWKLITNKQKWPAQVQNTEQPHLPEVIEPDEVYITHINHSTELIQLEKMNILSDPIFSERASPFSFIGPKRVRAPGLPFEALPKIDVVIISHNHYDHMDLPTLRQLAERDHPVFLVLLNNAHYLKGVGINNIVELDWWQHYQSTQGVTFTAVPEQHWSQRTPFDAYKALWGGFIIQSGDLKVFFAGDSGYGDHLKLIQERFGKMDVCLLPIGSYEPEWFMSHNHMNPEEAVKAHLLLDSSMSTAIHFGTFQLSDEGYDDPPNYLKAALKKYNVNESAFLAPSNGKTMHFKKPA